MSESIVATPPTHDDNLGEVTMTPQLEASKTPTLKTPTLKTPTQLEPPPAPKVPMKAKRVRVRIPKISVPRKPKRPRIYEIEPSKDMAERNHARRILFGLEKKSRVLGGLPAPTTKK